MLRLVSVCQQGGRKRQRLHEQLTAQTQLQQHVRLQQARQQRQEARAEAQAVAAGRVRREQAEQRDRAYAVEDRAYAVEASLEKAWTPPTSTPPEIRLFRKNFAAEVESLPECDSDDDSDDNDPLTVAAAAEGSKPFLDLS